MKNLARTVRCAAVMLGLCLAASTGLWSQWLPLNPVKSVESLPDGARIQLESGFLRFQVCSDSIVRVIYSLEREAPEHPDFLVVKKDWPKTALYPTNR